MCPLSFSVFSLCCHLYPLSLSISISLLPSFLFVSHLPFLPPSPLPHSYEEFYAMAKDPDPSRPGFDPEHGAKPAAKSGGWDPATGAPVPGPPTGGKGSSKTEQEMAAQAAQAALLRQEKRELLFTFQKQTQLTLRHLDSAYHKFKSQDKTHSGVLDLKGFCSLLSVEATGEFSRLIKLYDREGSKKIDVNEFLLGVSNFTGTCRVVCIFSSPSHAINMAMYTTSLCVHYVVMCTLRRYVPLVHTSLPLCSRTHVSSSPLSPLALSLPSLLSLFRLSRFIGAENQERVDFCFLLYDEDLNGFITVSELTKIVMANHLAADTAAVERKVATIMRQCDDDRSGHLNREEFKVCAEKFPNLLFPTFSS